MTENNWRPRTWWDWRKIHFYDICHAWSYGSMDAIILKYGTDKISKANQESAFYYGGNGRIIQKLIYRTSFLCTVKKMEARETYRLELRKTSHRYKPDDSDDES